MAKRFTDTNKYKKPFVRSLPGAYKLLWDFLYHDCDHSGIWIVDFEITQSYIGKDMQVEKEKALQLFNNDGEDLRIIEIDGGKKWFIPSFVEFQYGQLSEKNRAHMAVITQLRKYNLLGDNFSIKKNKVHTSPLQGAKDKDMDKEKELDKDKELERVQGEDFPEGKFDEAFDDIYLNKTAMSYREIDVLGELEFFKTKVRGSPDEYRHRDTGSLRLAFQYQLRTAKPKKNNVNGTSNKQQQHSRKLAESVIQAYRDVLAGGQVGRDPEAPADNN